MATKKQILDRAIKQAKDLAETLKLVGLAPAQKEAAFILARLETLRDVRFGTEYPQPPQEFLDRFSNRIED